MSGANVQSITTLSDLRCALVRFSGEASEALLSLDREIERTQDWLRQRLDHWRQEAARLRNELAVAQAALRVCERSGYRDRDGYYHEPDCRAQMQRAAEAQARLAHAESEADNARRWVSQVQQAVGQYQVHARRLADLTGSHTEKASACLSRAQGDLEAYLRVQLASGLGGGAPGVLAGMLTGTVDLSRPTEWGKFAHGAYEEAVEDAYGDEAQSEVRVTVTRPDGTEKRGRIDSLVGSTVIDYKTSKLDRLNENGGLTRALGKIKTQVASYCDSPDTPAGSAAAVVFQFRPADPACQQFVEDYLRDAGIQVLWDMA
jgi:hypothetical protein